MLQGQKTYFKYFDAFKFVCELFVVSNHLRLRGDWSLTWMHAHDIGLPMFVTMSVLLFWRKINWDSTDYPKLKHYFKRLLTLVVSWSILLMPFWLDRFMHRFPDTWQLYLVPKLLLYGGCRGGYFLMMLIYGTIFLYILHRLTGKVVPFVLTLLVATYYNLARDGIIDDFLMMRHKFAMFDTDYLAIRFLFYMEAGIFFIPYVARKIKRFNQYALFWTSVVLFIAISFTKSDLVSFISVSCFVIIFGALLYNMRCDKLSSWAVSLRYMSLSIYLLHFVVIDYGERAFRWATGIDPAAYGVVVEYLFVLAVTLPLSWFLSCVIARRYPTIKHLLL